MVELCPRIGVSYIELMQMDMNEINAFSKGSVLKREQSINDALEQSYTEAILNSQAVWGSKDFPKKAPRVNLLESMRPKTQEEVFEEIMKFREAVKSDYSRYIQ